MTGNGIEILLATCNGAAYLSALLDSLLAQTYGNWRLVIRDDGSTDDTPRIIGKYLANHPDRVSILRDKGETLGPCGNFARLLHHSKADYTMFCDQDDVWLPEKIELTMARMREMESLYGEDTPIMVHTDLRVVDGNLKPLSDSLWRYQTTDPDATALNRLLVQNVATGCTVMINRALRELALPIPVEARMHDWWLALVAAVFGRIGHVAQPTILYRQHGRNDSGAAPMGAVAALGKLLAPSTLVQRTELDLHIQRQAAAFLQRYGDRLSTRDRDLLDIYSRLHEQGFFMERYYRLKYGFLYAGFLMNIRLLLFR